MKLENLLYELEIEGIKNDSEASDRSYKQLNITKDTGEFLTILVKASNAETILEVGTSNGYSTLWLAAAIPDSGKVITLEIQQHKIDQAKINFDRSGLGRKIEVVKSDASEYFELSDNKFDFIFLDAERTEYINFSKEIISSLRIGGLLVCDNAISHKEEMIEFIEFIKGSNQFTTSLVPVGKGEFVAYKNT
ncbi:MAG: O-methyltransferase [Pseudomonadales bacterium]